jgi:hypothetical protein
MHIIFEHLSMLVHAPSVQVCPLGHLFPHLPQFFVSLWRSSHILPQSVWPDGQLVAEEAACELIVGAVAVSSFGSAMASELMIKKLVNTPINKAFLGFINPPFIFHPNQFRSCSF